MIGDILPPKPRMPKPDKPAHNPEPAAVAPKEPADELDQPIVLDGSKPEESDPPKKPKAHHRLRAMWAGWSRRRKIMMSTLGVLVLAGVAAGIYFAFFHHAKPTIPRVAKTVIVNNKPVTVASPLTGVQVAPDLAKRPITAIMIENSTDARPQSGLQDAGVVYEAIAEGGVTRFCALFQESRPEYIGPVRSLRPYYIDWFTPFDASIAHVGGSPDALSQIRGGGKDLDQFFNSGSYWRVNSRYAPHNVYTSFDRLDTLNESKGYITSNIQSFLRKPDQKLVAPTAKTIDLAISGYDYNVHYDYDAATNTYARSEGGAPHMDLVSASDTTGVQLKPKVVVAMVVPLSHGALDASGAFYSDYSVNGTGQVDVFQDGGVTQGTWVKTDRSSQITFTDSGGHKLKFDAGQTWITVLSDPSQIHYSP